MAQFLLAKSVCRVQSFGHLTESLPSAKSYHRRCRAACLPLPPCRRSAFLPTLPAHTPSPPEAHPVAVAPPCHWLPPLRRPVAGFPHHAAHLLPPHYSALPPPPLAAATSLACSRPAPLGRREGEGQRCTRSPGRERGGRERMKIASCRSAAAAATPVRRYRATSLQLCRAACSLVTREEEGGDKSLVWS